MIDARRWTHWLVIAAGLTAAKRYLFLAACRDVGGSQ